MHGDSSLADGKLWKEHRGQEETPVDPGSGASVESMEDDPARGVSALIWLDVTTLATLTHIFAGTWSVLYLRSPGLSPSYQRMLRGSFSRTLGWQISPVIDLTNPVLSQANIIHIIVTYDSHHNHAILSFHSSDAMVKGALEHLRREGHLTSKDRIFNSLNPSFFTRVTRSAQQK